MTPPPDDARAKNEALSVKQKRAADRDAKLAAFRQAQARQKRNRLIGILTGSVAAVAVVGLVIGFVVTASTPKPDPSSIAISGLETYPGLTANHVTTTVDYPQNPPVGGDHAGVWLNCGVYTEPVPNENAVHSLEHGALWVTYDPDLSADELTTLKAVLPSTYVILSPFEGLPSPIVVSGWNVQLQVESADDERIAAFFEEHWKSNSVPEPGALCTGAYDAPGKA